MRDNNILITLFIIIRYIKIININYFDVIFTKCNLLFFSL